LVGSDQSAQSRLDAENREKVAAHPEAAHFSRLAAAADEERRVPPRKEARERSLLSADLLPQRVGDLGVGIRRHAEAVNTISAYFGQFLRMLNREAAQSDRVNQLKDCRVRADAECK